jgi:hypothetical protein
VAETPKRAGPTLLVTAATSQTIYTAPAGGSTWALLREIMVVNETAAAVKFSLGIGTSNADAAGKRIAKDVSLAVGGQWSWGGFMVLYGGGTPDLLYAICDTNNGATVTVGLVEGP